MFQPYGWCEPYPRFLGLPSDKPLAMFAELYHEIMGGEINSDQTSNFLAVILRELGVHLGLKTIKILVMKGQSLWKKSQALPLITTNYSPASTYPARTLWETA